MKKSYKIEVDCANCAQKMNVEFDEGADIKATMQNVLSACKKVEDDCEIFGI